MALLEVAGIGKSFGSTAVLRNISFELQKGEALALIGSSGSGKTTLLRCLNSLETADAGSITVAGETLWSADDARTQSEAVLRKKRLHFGLVFQNFNLFPQYTALQNVMLAGELLAKERPDYKQNRKQGDPLSKTIPTKLFNATARKVSGIHNLHDFNCGLKAYRKEVVKNIEVYGEMHRYIPYLAKNAGFDKIGEKPVHHQARKFGKSKFMGWNRFFNGYLDLITLWFLSNFGKKPMHVFGFLGTIVFFIGFISAFLIGVDKLWALSHGVAQRLVTDSPYFYIALTMMMIGTQLFLAGFIGDLVSRSSQNRNDYQIEEEIRCGK